MRALTLSLALTGLLCSAAAHAYQSIVILDGGHPSRELVEDLICPGPDKEQQCPGYQSRISYITCQGGTCYETSTPVAGGPEPGHAYKVAGVAVGQIGALAQSADAEYRVMFAQTLGSPGEDRWVPLVNWLLETNNGVSRAEQLGVRVLNMSMGGGIEPCIAPTYSSALASLASKGVTFLNATGNARANAFTRSAHAFPSGSFFASGQHMCFQNVVSVGMSSLAEECVYNNTGNPGMGYDVRGCKVYPVWHNANHTANTTFIANGCLSESLCGLNQLELGTSYSSARTAGGLMAAVLRRPSAGSAAALTNLHQVAEAGTFTIGSASGVNPYYGQSVPYKRLGASEFSSAFDAICAANSIFPNEGFWYDPAMDGSGVNLHHHGDSMSGTWFTYDGNGHPVWYQFSGVRSTCGNQFSGPVALSQLINGSRHQTAVGYGTISFHSSTSSTFDWELRIGGQRFRDSQPLSLLSWASGAAGNPNLTALWHQPAEPGWGYSIASYANIHTPVLFIYDANGQPRWVTADGQSVVGNAVTFPLYYFIHTNLCPWCTGGSTRTVHPVGTFTHYVNTSRVDVNVQSAAGSAPGQISWYRYQLSVQPL